MWFSARSRILSLTWMLVPTLLWSLFFHIPVLCIDPLLLPAIEKRVSSKFIVFGRLIWVVIFAMILLKSWNISPRTYLFYLHEALPFTPKFVLGGLGITVILLIWFSLLPNISQKLGGWYAWTFAVGVIVFVVKISAALGIVYAPTIRQHIASPLLANAHLLFAAARANPNKTGTVAESPESTFYSFVKQQELLPSQVVLMLVESWGERHDTLAAMADDIRNQGFQIKKFGFTSYRGSTLSGEFRELCSKYVQPSDGIMDEVQNMRCAPQYLFDKGYQTIGVHGYQGSFYARNTFWKRFGIKNKVFGDKLQSQPQCPGPFPAVCDENLIQFGIDMLNNSIDPVFLYILTISSHEPVDPAALNRRGKYFSELKVDHSTQVVARRAISALVAGLQDRRQSGCTLVYIVGDHQPPSASVQGDVFEPEKVPYLTFTQNCAASQK